MTRPREGNAGTTSGRARRCLAVMVFGYLAVAAIAGSRHSPITTPLPVGARKPTWTVVLANVLGLQHVARPILTAVTLALVVGLFAAFVLLAVEARASRVRVSDVLIASGISLVVMALAPMLISRDILSYAAYARIYAVHHHNPYVFAPASFPQDPFVALESRQWLPTTSLYGPAFTLVGAAIVRGWLGSPGSVILAYKVIAGAGIATAAVCAALTARVVNPQRAALAAALVGLNPVLLIHTVGGGHADALLAAPLAGAVALAVTAPREGSAWLPVTLRSAGATALFTMACLIKAVVAPALLLWLWWDVGLAPRRSRLKTAAIHLAIVVAMSAALLAPFVDGSHSLAPIANRIGIEEWASGAALVARGALGAVGQVAGSSAGSVARNVVVGVFLLAFAALFVRLGPGTRTIAPDPSRPSIFGPLVAALGTALLLLALTVPYLLPWYAAWFAPFLALMDDDVLLWLGVGVCGLLALTVIPADPPHGLSAWGVMLGVHYAIAPFMLVLLVVAARRVVNRYPAPVGGAQRPWRR